MYIYIQVNYAISGIHEKVFKSDLTTQIKNTSTLTLLRITFFCYLFVLGNFVRFSHDFSYAIIMIIMIYITMIDTCPLK